jgi:hypothetical protein
VESIVTEFQQRLARMRQWAMDAQAEGWLSLADIGPLVEMGDRTPATLFEPGVHRPLVVAFFGGTGVGKSTLLNRLARQPVAKVGVERPTSREISLYAHETIQIRQLPEGMPLERIRFAHHNDESRRQVLWIDMPDIDSTATENRELVIQWLPHIDVLIYVVSPERYRDDKGWRLLQEQGASHAWLFALNQWDRGFPEQLADFRSLLQRGGFAEPIVLTTRCRDSEKAAVGDEFDRLEEIVQSLADKHVVEQLERRSQVLQQQELQSAAAACLRKLGGDVGWAGLKQNWKSIWEVSRELLRKGLAWPVRELAQTYVRHESSPLHKSIRLDAPETGGADRRRGLLWDDWTAMQLDDALDRLVLEMEPGAAAEKLKTALDAPAAAAGRRIESRAQLGLRQALANPGTSLQRFFLRFTGVVAIVLPLCAIAWVSWQAVSAYYASGQTHAGYLGVDFAIHSVLLIAISWLLPYFVNRQLRPSTERAAHRGLQQGVEQGLLLIEDDVADAIVETHRDSCRWADEARAIMGGAGREDGGLETMSDLLARMLPGNTPAP